MSAASGGSRGGWCALRYGLLALALAVAAGVYAAPARAEPAKPTPEKLWQAYPLNPPPRTGGQQTGTTQHQGPAAQSPSTGDRASGGSSWWPLALGLGGAVLLVLIGAVLVATRLQPSFPRPSRARLRAALAPARGSVEALASAASRGARAAAAGVQHVPTVVAERRPRMPRVPRVPRPTLPRVSVATATALTEPLLASVRAHVRRVPEREAEVARPSATPRQEHLGDTLPEAEILKRKAVTARADETAKLKQKSKSRTATLPPADEKHDVEVLKAKLASHAEPAPEPEPVRAPVELRPVRAVGSAAPAAEPLRSPARRQRPRPAPTAAAPLCRIEWWRGYRKSHFDARVRTAEGGEAVLLISPPFRWSKPTPPPKHLPEVARAHSVLLAKLEERGWIVTGSGADWYALELRGLLSEIVDPAERQKGET